MQHLARFHQPIDRVLARFVLRDGVVFGQRHVHLRGSPPALARMRLVDDDCERAPAMLVTDFVQHKREFLHCSDDQLLAIAQKAPQITGALGMANSGTNLGELFNRVADLLVEVAPVGDNDY